MSTIVGVAVVCAAFLVTLYLVLHKRPPSANKEDTKAGCSLGCKSLDDKCEETAPEVSSDAKKAVVTEMSQSNEDQLDPEYYAVFWDPVSRNRNEADNTMMDVNLSCGLSTKKHYCEDTSEAFRQHNNCAYDHYNVPKEQQSPPEAE